MDRGRHVHLGACSADLHALVLSLSRASHFEVGKRLVGTAPCIRVLHYPDVSPWVPYSAGVFVKCRGPAVESVGESVFLRRRGTHDRRRATTGDRATRRDR